MSLHAFLERTSSLWAHLLNVISLSVHLHKYSAFIRGWTWTTKCTLLPIKRNIKYDVLEDLTGTLEASFKLWLNWSSVRRLQWALKDSLKKCFLEIKATKVLYSDKCARL